jgi:primosomal protein N' (replication factor Y)
LRLASEVLGSGKSVLILVPEIALLPLIVHRARKALEFPMSILHSELSDRERVEEWQKTRQGKVHLVFGTRSAVFAPLRDLGLIVIDEEHDGAYKQNEYPRYHARETAIMRATFEKCPVVLGSATPSVESFYNSGNGKYEYLSLPYRVESRKLPHIHLVDMKQEYKEFGNPFFSRYLLEQITKKLNRKEQILILLNRRGYASSLMCRECGSVLECPNCSITLTYHKFVRRMRCHYCDYSRLAPRECEKCGSGFLNLSGIGTERIVESLKKSYPSARIERFDRDATRKKGSIVSILTRFALKEIDILVGTQMLAKGHDFPDVTLVGVVSADSSIGIPDFRASERLFQLLTQVAGRSGRGNEPGLVVLQTYHPDHYAIQCAIQHSYEGFYEKEIRFRRLMQYPPFQALANVVFSGKDSKKVLEEAREMGKLILAFKTEPMKMLGPAIAPLARLSGLYRFQILLKSPVRKDLRECLRSAIQHFRKKEKTHSQVSVDIDPYSIV